MANPYDYQRYLDLMRPPIGLPPRAGMSHGDIERYRLIRQEAEEAMWRDRHIQEYYDSCGGIHTDLRRAWQAESFIEGIKGLSDCRRGSYYQDPGRR